MLERLYDSVYSNFRKAAIVSIAACALYVAGCSGNVSWGNDGGNGGYRVHRSCEPCEPEHGRHNPGWDRARDPRLGRNSESGHRPEPVRTNSGRGHRR